MRGLSFFLLMLLAACQNAAIDRREVGDAAWFKQVDRELSISDEHGHGPDYGSQEWCNAVHFKLYGQHAAEPVSCDRNWMKKVDRAIEQKTPK